MSMLIKGPTQLFSTIQVSPDNAQLPGAAGRSSAIDMFETLLSQNNSQIPRSSRHDAGFGQKFVELFGSAAANEDTLGVAPAMPGLEGLVTNLPNQDENLASAPPLGANDSTSSSDSIPEGSMQLGSAEEPKAEAFSYERNESGEMDRVEMIDVVIGDPNGLGVPPGKYGIVNTGYQLGSSHLGSDLLSPA